MKGLIPFNHRRSSLARTSFEDFYNMLDDFFSDGFMRVSRNPLCDSFKLDIEETDSEYRIEAELPGVNKEAIDLSIDSDALCISVNRVDEVSNEGKNYIHRERRVSSMSRRVQLANAVLSEAKAKLDGGILTIIAPKIEKSNSTDKISIE